MTDYIVEAHGLTKTYKVGRNEVQALRGVDLRVKRGEFVAIVGRSGSGKSTLLNLLGCLDRPTKGTILLDGEDVTAAPKSRLPLIRREKIGFVFQQFNLIPTLTAIENVMLPLKYARVPGHRRRDMGIAALERVDLAERVDHRPSELSGGEQQRVAVARSLVNTPAIVLADEPTGELDSHTALLVVAMMKELSRATRQTFLIVTHDPLVANETERIIRLNDGVVESDTPVLAAGGALPRLR